MKFKQTKCAKMLYKIPFSLMLILVIGIGKTTIAQTTGSQTGNNVAPKKLPGKGPGQFDFFYAGEAKDRNMYIVRGGKITWSYIDTVGRGEISDAILMKNGNILVTSNNRFVKEITRNGKVVWAYILDEILDYKVSSPQLATRLPNGNTLINNWFNQWNGKLDPDNAPVQAIEVTPAKKIVWALRSWTNPVNLGPSTTIQLLDDTNSLENVHFGEIR